MMKGKVKMFREDDGLCPLHLEFVDKNRSASTTTLQCANGGEKLVEIHHHTNVDQNGHKKHNFVSLPERK